MTRAAILAAALCAAAAARADEPTPVVVEVGKTVDLCKAKLAPCPASTVMCDASSIARLQNGAEGVELKGISPGKTLCTVLGFERTFRRVLSVTVKAAPGEPASPKR
jgi:hypothetical protein